MKQPLVSIIIPTRNRQVYAKKTVLQILGLNQDIEIIVHDNSDEDSLYSELGEYIEQGQVKYRYTKELLSFSDNYNKATELVTGSFFCAIGDDDGILPNIIECAKWMEDNRIDIVKPAKDQVFFYPGNNNKRKNACIGFSKYSGSFYYSNPETSIISLLDDGGCNYLEKNTAGSYHGLVSMDAMNRVRDITGFYYSGLTPDMYSVVCLSLLPDVRFAIIDYPISLPGVCPLSGSASSDSGKHVGRLEDAPHLNGLPDYRWSEYVPRYYSVETIWAETMIYAIKQMGRDELIDKYYNSNRLAAHLYLNNKAQRNAILNVLSKDAVEYVVASCRDIQQNNNSQLSSALEKMAIKLSGKRKVIRNVSEISSAVNILSEELKKTKGTAPWM